jgi:hypothetical protein
MWTSPFRNNLSDGNAFPENSGTSPEGVLHPVMGVLFGETRECTVGSVLLFDWGGEEKWPCRLADVH